ncbi:hypothetical protein [Tsukamurella strandjordii]|uniref:hypothetical protein n=1 Tax=Tsukamurella strandjordii TaxID=147577 RepID=UPI0031D8019D
MPLIACLVFAGCSDNEEPKNPVAGLALDQAELPPGTTISIRKDSSAWGSGTTLGGPEPCFTATRNKERATTGTYSSLTTGIWDNLSLEGEVYAEPLTAESIVRAQACVPQGMTLFVVSLPDDLVRKRASVFEYRTPQSRLASMSGFIEVEGRSVRFTSDNAALLDGSEGVIPREVDRDQFWELFRAQIAKVERAR